MPELSQSSISRCSSSSTSSKNDVAEDWCRSYRGRHHLSTSESLLEIVSEDEGIFSDEDFMVFGENLESNSTAALMIFENVWATRFVEAVSNANGTVVLNERIPRSVVEELEAELA